MFKIYLNNVHGKQDMPQTVGERREQFEGNAESRKWLHRMKAVEFLPPNRRANVVDYQGYAEDDLIGFTPELRAEALRNAKQYGSARHPNVCLRIRHSTASN